ncbi:proline dehydrogenase [Nonomuraea thailandensis]|uniref:proline dehydrogenase n=1 Tax=Nonomuraea thailandensis TaxID=1188745 RepID=A0A9X2G9W7_9ACTN|nr:proline dehydrogenase family protein [Nonomuraea thailandensis]MCP2353479.1 proline dehydrogenase [Nonomuraea thailandensis]
MSPTTVFGRIGQSAFRSLILSAANNRRIQAMADRHGLEAGADRFVAGETLVDAMRVIERLRDDGMRTYVIALGEAIHSRQGAAAAADLYEQLIPDVAARGPGTTFSIKLTHLGIELDRDLALGHARRIISRAAEHAAFVRLDMEHSAVVDDTLAIYRALRSDGLDNTGIVLQAYLHRSLDDLIGLLPLEPNVRVVKGAYLEPPGVALQRKSHVDVAYNQLARTALSHAKFTAVATHDAQAIRAAAAVAQRTGADFEFQMLYGVRYALAQQMVARGHAVRICVPFGKDWFVYFTRRLAERPSNVLFLARNLGRR